MAVRFAEAGDIPALLNIYNQYIDTAITFEYFLPTEAEFAERMKNISGIYPYLVYEEKKRVIGYAYAHRQKERDAYKWNAELSIYIERDSVSKGYGKSLYSSLIEVLRLQGIKTVYGGVTLPNEKSEKLHMGLGFKPIGIYHNTGYKCGSWHDVIWYEKEIAGYEGEPADIIPVSRIPKNQIFDVFNKYERNSHN